MAGIEVDNSGFDLETNQELAKINELTTELEHKFALNLKDDFSELKTSFNSIRQAFKNEKITNSEMLIELMSLSERLDLRLQLQVSPKNLELKNKLTTKLFQYLRSTLNDFDEFDFHYWDEVIDKKLWNSDLVKQEVMPLVNEMVVSDYCKEKGFPWSFSSTDKGFSLKSNNEIEVPSYDFNLANYDKFFNFNKGEKLSYYTNELEEESNELEQKFKKNTLLNIDLNSELNTLEDISIKEKEIINLLMESIPDFDQEKAKRKYEETKNLYIDIRKDSESLFNSLRNNITTELEPDSEYLSSENSDDVILLRDKVVALLAMKIIEAEGHLVK